VEIRELGPRVRCIVGLAVVIYDTDKKGVGTRSDSTWICFVFSVMQTVRVKFCV